MAYPTDLSALTNPTAGDDTSTVDHAAQHSTANDAIEALEAKVGVDSSAVTSSLDYKSTNAASVDPGHKHTPTTSLVITGTPDGSKFLRDDDTWAEPPTVVDADETTQGGVEEATTAEVDAGTASGTVAKLFITPAKLAASIFGLQLPTRDEKDALAGTGTPASGNKFVTQDTLDAIQKDSQTAGATISGATTPVACYMLNSDDEWYACDANDQTKLDFQGFAITNGTDGASMDIQFEGIVPGFTSLTKGARYYVSDTGTMTTTMGTYEVYVGIALSTTEILIDKGANASWQYMGSDTQADATNLTSPAGARFAVIKIEVRQSSDDNTNAITAELTLSSHGKTTGVLKKETPGGASEADIGITASWSGTTITMTEITDTTESDYTAYYYR